MTRPCRMGVRTDPLKNLPPAADGAFTVAVKVDGVSWRTSLWRERESGWVTGPFPRTGTGKTPVGPVPISITVDSSRW